MSSPAMQEARVSNALASGWFHQRVLTKFEQVIGGPDPGPNSRAFDSVLPEEHPLCALHLMARFSRIEGRLLSFAQSRRVGWTDNQH